MSTMTEELYDLLAGAELPEAFLWGDVPEDAPLPYLAYFCSSSSVGRIANDTGLSVRRAQVDVWSRQLSDAEAIADAVESLLVGETLAAAENWLPLERSEGRYRFAEAVPGLTEGETHYRVSLLFEQRGATAL